MASDCIATFRVPGRPVPWKATQVGTSKRKDGTRYRFVTKDRKLEVWQQAVNIHARVAMSGLSQHEGPVQLAMTFYLVRKGNLPDWTNLAKAAEDALQGAVFPNDRQVHLATVEKVIVPKDSWEGVEITVRAFQCGTGSAIHRTAEGRGSWTPRSAWGGN